MDLEDLDFDIDNDKDKGDIKEDIKEDMNKDDYDNIKNNSNKNINNLNKNEKIEPKLSSLSTMMSKLTSQIDQSNFSSYYIPATNSIRWSAFNDNVNHKSIILKKRKKYISSIPDIIDESIIFNKKPNINVLTTYTDNKNRPKIDNDIWRKIQVITKSKNINNNKKYQLLTSSSTNSDKIAKTNAYLDVDIHFKENMLTAISCHFNENEPIINEDIIDTFNEFDKKLLEIENSLEIERIAKNNEPEVVVTKEVPKTIIDVDDVKMEESLPAPAVPAPIILPDAPRPSLTFELAAMASDIVAAFGDADTDKIEAMLFNDFENLPPPSSLIAPPKPKIVFHNVPFKTVFSLRAKMNFPINKFKSNVKISKNAPKVNISYKEINYVEGKLWGELEDEVAPPKVVAVQPPPAPKRRKSSLVAMDIDDAYSDVEESKIVEIKKQVEPENPYFNKLDYTINSELLKASFLDELWKDDDSIQSWLAPYSKLILDSNDPLQSLSNADLNSLAPKPIVETQAIVDLNHFEKFPPLYDMKLALGFRKAQLLKGVVVEEMDLSDSEEEQLLSKPIEIKSHGHNWSTEPTFVAQNDIMEDFHLLSHDSYYERVKTKLQDIRHSAPASNLDFRVISCMFINNYQLWHRPPLLIKPLPLEQTKESNFTNKYKLITPNETFRGGVYFVPKKMKHLSNFDNRVILMEYVERYPSTMQLVGMASHIKTFYRQMQDDSFVPETEDGTVQILNDQSDEPFLIGDIEAGSKPISAIDNKLFIAPINKHPVKQNDFILTKTENGWMMRQAHGLYVVGQCQPKIRTMHPSERERLNFTRNRFFAYVARSLKDFYIRMQAKIKHIMMNTDDKARQYALIEVTKFRDDSQQSLINDLHTMFPELKDSEIRKKISDHCIYSDGWRLKPDFVPESDSAIEALMSPEEMCVYDGMRIYDEKLNTIGMNLRELKVAHSATVHNCALRVVGQYSDAARYTDRQLQLAPWNTSSAFLDATKGKTTIKLTKAGNPLAQLHGLVYFRASTRIEKAVTGFKTLGQQLKDKGVGATKASITGTELDLRKLTVDELVKLSVIYGKSENVKASDVIPLHRWAKVRFLKGIATRRVQREGVNKVDPQLLKWARDDKALKQDRTRDYNSDLQQEFLSHIESLDVKESNEIDLDAFNLFALELERDLQAEDEEVNAVQLENAVKVKASSETSNNDLEAFSNDQLVRRPKGLRFQLIDIATSMRPSMYSPDYNKSSPYMPFSRAMTPSFALTQIYENSSKIKASDGAPLYVKVDIPEPPVSTTQQTIKALKWVQHVRDHLDVNTSQKIIVDTLAINLYNKLNAHKDLLAKQLKDVYADGLGSFQLNPIAPELNQEVDQEVVVHRRHRPGVPKKPDNRPVSKMNCSKCGQLGHISSNTSCPMYNAEDRGRTQHHRSFGDAATSGNILVSRNGRDALRQTFRNNTGTNKVHGGYYDDEDGNDAVIASTSGFNISINLKKGKELVMEDLLEKEHREAFAAAMHGSNRAQGDSRRKFQALLSRFWKGLNIINKNSGEWFSFPVDTDQLKDYLTIVKQPMDLYTIKENVDNFQYINTAAMLQDVELIHKASALFNGPDNWLTQKALALVQVFQLFCKKCEIEIKILEQEIYFHDLFTNVFGIITNLPCAKDYNCSAQTLMALPNYKTLVKSPITFQDIVFAIENYSITSVFKFMHKLALMKSNSEIYHGPNAIISQNGRELISATIDILKNYGIKPEELDIWYQYSQLDENGKPCLVTWDENSVKKTVGSIRAPSLKIVLKLEDKDRRASTKRSPSLFQSSNRSGNLGSVTPAFQDMPPSISRF